MHDLRTDELAVEQPVAVPQRESVSLAKCEPFDEPVHVAKRKPDETTEFCVVCQWDPRWCRDVHRRWKVLPHSVRSRQGMLRR